MDVTLCGQFHRGSYFKVEQPAHFRFACSAHKALFNPLNSSKTNQHTLVEQLLRFWMVPTTSN
ncbi:hypothetical protein N474_20385 [Pseudoalteromonas luteoviolacea CPMOR-2]|nr:hypothetical protein N474_20385 [Pseudoalteromonas luteoviolacea CPMOR-2]